MKCPHCGVNIPIHDMRVEVGRRNARLRKEYAGGRPRQPQRCPCGKYTRTYARRWHHHCEAPPPPAPAEGQTA